MQKKDFYTLSELFPDAALTGNAEIRSLTDDSRKAFAGTLFVCVKGIEHDGHDYAMSAYENGCRAFLSERKLALPDDAAVAVCKNSRKSLATAAATLAGNPADSLRIIGITGTKGKTTVANYIFASLNAAGKKTMMIGTGGADVDETHIGTANTTPGSIELNRLFGIAVERGCEFVVMEVSSQAVKQYRVYGLKYEIAVFTNLAQDHISQAEHKNLKEYRLCKSEVFRCAKSCVVNADDKNAEFMAKCCKGNAVRVSRRDGADYTITDVRGYRTSEVLGTRFDLVRNGDPHRVSVPQPGEFSAYNAALAVAACRVLGLGYSLVTRALANAVIPGRSEIIPLGNGQLAVIDYAHNESSFEAILGVLSTMSQQSGSRLMCLFGSVGGRAENRREGLARAAEKYCDFVFLTSDNPDRESPIKIITEIEKGFSKDFTSYAKIPDRESAIYTAVRMMRKNDILVLAGKGSEDYQLVNGARIPFSERSILSRAEEENTVSGRV